MAYPDLSSLGNNSDIGGLFSLPNSVYPFFWALILAGIFFIIALSGYFREKSINGRGNLLKTMAVASFATIVLAGMGSVIGFVTVEILVPTIVFGCMIIAAWIFSN